MAACASIKDSNRHKSLLAVHTWTHNSLTHSQVIRHSIIAALVLGRADRLISTSHFGIQRPVIKVPSSQLRTLDVCTVTNYAPSRLNQRRGASVEGRPIPHMCRTSKGYRSPFCNQSILIQSHASVSSFTVIHLISICWHPSHHTAAPS